MKKILIIAFVLVFLVGGFLFLNNKPSQIQMLDYRLDEVVKNFTHESVGGINHTNNTDFQVSLSKIKELENLTFYEEQLLQNASEIMTINDNDVYIYILKDDQNYYLATNSFKFNNNGTVVVPLIDGYEYVYTSDSLEDWVSNLLMHN